MNNLEYFAKVFSSNPIRAIEEWAKDNRREGDLLKIIPKLAESQMRKVENELDYCKNWAPLVVDMHGLKELNDETASLFNYLFQCVIHGVEPNEKMMNKIKEVVPKMKTPCLFFRPAAKWLADRGIRFADGKDEDFKKYDGRPEF